MTSERNGMRIAGLFAGIGGLELGLQYAGHQSALLCEIDEYANRVLARHFSGVERVEDVRDLSNLPDVDLVTAGFPCQDLSQAGQTKGIEGGKSGVVSEVFRLLDQTQPTWLLLENVPFMLRLERGRAMHYLASELTHRGFNWAYRIVDTRAFGLPQRRKRVLMLASKERDPREILLVDDVVAPKRPSHRGRACGFYWTEGVRGLGWAVDAVPTLKGGSTVGIPSPPAIWMPDGTIVTPDIRDAERLQGFPAGWTEPAVDDPRKRNGPRWRLVGNAVSVPVAEWVGHCLSTPRRYLGWRDSLLHTDKPWPSAAWSMQDGVYEAKVSQWPTREPMTSLCEFLQYEVKPLSLRAAAGFEARTRRSSLNFPEGFLGAIRDHIERMEDAARVAS